MSALAAPRPRRPRVGIRSPRSWCGPLLLLLLPGATARAGGSPDLGRLKNDRGPHPVPAVPRPTLHSAFVDPTFGTRILRITAPEQIPGETKRVRHYYAKSNPFNADNSRFIAFASDGSAWLYDTATWKPMKKLTLSSSDPEIQWHPTDPGVFYSMETAGTSREVRALSRYEIASDSRTTLQDFAEYDWARGKLEGNMDTAGRYYALIGAKGRSLQAFVYDLEKNRRSPAIEVTEKMAGDWISVSPSGRFVVLMGGDRSRVYDTEMRHLRDLPPGSFGHGDLCTTADGRDVLVYDGADRELDGNRNINVADLESGKEGKVVRLGWKTTPHVSCRNTAMPGWALVSTQGPDRSYPDRDFEIFWAKLDGSGEIRRVAHHHSSREEGGYFAEQHAVSDRSGAWIVFSSNWGKGEVSDYLVDLAPRSEPAARRRAR